MFTISVFCDIMTFRISSTNFHFADNYISDFKEALS